MFDGQFVSAQLMDFLPRREFNDCVERYGVKANNSREIKECKQPGCWNRNCSHHRHDRKNFMLNRRSKLAQ